jgi:hypothetical protein
LQIRPCLCSPPVGGSPGRIRPCRRSANSGKAGPDWLHEINHDGFRILARQACKLGCEGIVSKRLGSPYRSGRSRQWVKVENPAAPAVRREADEDCAVTGADRRAMAHEDHWLPGFNFEGPEPMTWKAENRPFPNVDAFAAWLRKLHVQRKANKLKSQKGGPDKGGARRN